MCHKTWSTNIAKTGAQGFKFWRVDDRQADTDTQTCGWSHRQAQTHAHTQTQDTWTQKDSQTWPRAVTMFPAARRPESSTRRCKSHAHAQIPSPCGGCFPAPSLWILRLQGSLGEPCGFCREHGSKNVASGCEFNATGRLRHPFHC